MSEPYMSMVLDGRALWTDIDDYVDRWHEGDDSESLHDYLGFTPEEYSLWVEQPQALRLIIAARERGIPVLRMVEEAHDHALAARGGLSERDARAVRTWLLETGRLPRS
jgi:hypothetical protein